MHQNDTDQDWLRIIATTQVSLMCIATNHDAVIFSCRKKLIGTNEL